MNNNDLLKEFDKFLNGKEITTDEEFDKAFNEFIISKGLMSPEDNEEPDEEDVYYYLDLAQSATSKKNALKYAKKALELEPDNLDAEAMVAECSATSFEALIEKYEALLEKEKNKLTKQGYFKADSIGDFWLIFETRPYMRLYDSYVHLLIDCGKMKTAVKHCVEMLRLCENDNLGIRHSLMNLYAYLEDDESAIELFKKYENEYSAMFLLPLSILYYKLGDLKKSAKYLKELKNTNEDTLEFFKGINKGQMDFLENENPYGYRPFTIEELMLEFAENPFLFVTTKTYFEWAYKKLKNMKS